MFETLIAIHIFQRFFGIIRQSSGADDHPTPNQFLYVYRLLSVSNLVKPGKRMNVESKPVDILLTIQKLQQQPTPFIPQIEILIDEILSQDSYDQSDVAEHAYNVISPEQCITFYLGGYVTQKLSKFTLCPACTAKLTDDSKQIFKQTLFSESKLVELKMRGGLKLPSSSLTFLIRLLEECFQKFSEKPNTNMFSDILNAALNSDKLSFAGIGCEEHRTSLTARCIYFYITMRLHFFKKSVNRNRASRQTKQKLSKVSKLT